MTKTKYITYIAILTALVLFLLFERFNLDEIRIVSAALTVIHLKHFIHTVVDLAHKITA